MTDKTPEKVMESDSDDIDDNCIDTTMDETEQNDMKSQRPTLIIPQIHHHHHHNHNHHHTIASNHTLNNNAQQQLKRPALAIKSITGQTQFLVPVTTGQSYKKQQLLVMPHKKMVYLKQSSSSSSTMVKVPINNNNVNQNNNSIPLQQTQNTSSQSVNHHSTSILIRTSPLKSPVMKVPIVKSFYNKTHQSPKLTEKQMKDNFMESLGLVTKEALTELQSRRGERKRRTTANPQYSNAALEVKRIHNQEMAERRLAKRKFNTNNNNNHQMNGNSHGHSQMQHNTRNNSHVNNNYLNSPATSTGYVMEGKVLRPIIIEFDEISLDVHLVISLSNFANANCYECNELCECDCDSILYCKCCKTIFHATCADTIDDIKKNGTVHCPCCEKTRKQYEQLLNKRLAQKKELLQKRSDWEVKVNQMRDMLIELTQTLKKKQQDIELHVKEEELLHQRLELLRDTVKMVKETDDLGLCRETPSDEFEESHDKDDVNDDDGDYKENDESMDSETEKAAAQLEQMAKDNAEDGDDVDEPISSDVIHQQVDNDQLEEVQIYDLHCHESGIYDDIMVEEEVHESVMITDAYHTASDNNNSATIEFFNGHHQVSDDHHHVILY